MKQTRVVLLIERFLDFPYAIVEVTDWTHSRPENCSISIKQAAKRMGYRVGAFVKHQKVYMYKEDGYVR